MGIRYAARDVCCGLYGTVDVQHPDEPEVLESLIRSVYSRGGGIYVYTSLEAAYTAMQETDTPLKHIILFSDADDSEEQVKGNIFGGHSTFGVATTDHASFLAKQQKEEEGVTLPE